MTRWNVHNSPSLPIVSRFKHSRIVRRMLLPPPSRLLSHLHTPVPRNILQTQTLCLQLAIEADKLIVG